MATRTLHGAPASPGEALGRLWRAPVLAVADGEEPPIAEAARPAEVALALQALGAAAAELERLATSLPPSEALILEANIMMATDPTLTAAVQRHVLSEGMAAAGALQAATDDQAMLLAALPDPTLAGRADDLRSLGRRAAAVLHGGDGHEPLVPEGAVVVADDLGPGDVPEIAARAAGVVLARGGATTHAAIVARSLGLPMVCGAGPEMLTAPVGVLALLDGTVGAVTLSPSEPVVAAADARISEHQKARDRDRSDRGRPSETVDGHPVAVLANVSSPAEFETALGFGAAGVGLVRTELAFLDFPQWPTVRQHESSLRPLLDALGGRRAVVRTLDLGGDKTPPFMAPTPLRGLRLLMTHPEQFDRQAEALLRLALVHDLRVLLPMVEDAEQLLAARRQIADVAVRFGIERIPPIGAMVETPVAAHAAAQIARHCEFMSIGTNDLTAATFGEDRFSAEVTTPHHPRVLAHVASVVEGAHAAGIPVEVCGEAASSATMVPLLVGLGVDELSVGAARVGEVRRWVRRLSFSRARVSAERALDAPGPDEVVSLARHALTPESRQPPTSGSGRVPANAPAHGPLVKTSVSRKR